MKMLRYLPRWARIFSRTAGAMRSGRLCSSGGRQQTSMAVQPFARRRAAISCASAPQAMISVPQVVFTHPLRCPQALSGGARGPARGDQALRRLDRDRRVAAVGIRPDSLAELLIERRAADQHDEVVADVLFAHL